MLVLKKTCRTSEALIDSFFGQVNPLLEVVFMHPDVNLYLWRTVRNELFIGLVSWPAKASDTGRFITKDLSIDSKGRDLSRTKLGRYLLVKPHVSVDLLEKIILLS